MKPIHELVPPHWHKYVGTRPVLSDPEDRALAMAFSLIAECMCAASAPHWQVASGALQLCAETAAFIDGDYGFLESPYVPGSRPMLEAFVAEVVSPDMSAQETALALRDAVHHKHLVARFGQPPAFLYGESEEETLLKGGGHCSCRSRLLTALYQVAGLQARPVMFWVVPDRTGKLPFVGGHTVLEVWVDGGWAFIDGMLAMHCRKADGSLASIAELDRNPGLLAEMPAEVVDKMGTTEIDRFGLPLITYFAERFLGGVCPILYSRYDIHATPRPSWNWADASFRERQKHDYAIYKQVCGELAAAGKLTDDVYRMDNLTFRDYAGLDSLQLRPPRAELI